MIRVVCLACDFSMVLVGKICQGGHRWILWAKISTRSRLAAQQNHTTSKRPRERQAAMVSASNNAQVYKAPAVPKCAKVQMSQSSQASKSQSTRYFLCQCYKYSGFFRMLLILDFMCHVSDALLSSHRPISGQSDVHGVL